MSSPYSYLATSIQDISAPRESPFGWYAQIQIAVSALFRARLAFHLPASKDRCFRNDAQSTRELTSVDVLRGSKNRGFCRDRSTNSSYNFNSCIASRSERSPKDILNGRIADALLFIWQSYRCKSMVCHVSPTKDSQCCTLCTYIANVCKLIRVLTSTRS